MAHEHGSNKGHAVADNTEKQTLYKLGIEMAAAGIWSDLLNTSAVNWLMCWMGMQWEMLTEGALPKHPSRVKRGTRHSQHLIQPSGFDVSDISLNLPLLTQILPLYAGLPCPSSGDPAFPTPASSCPLLSCSLAHAQDDRQCLVPWLAPRLLGQGTVGPWGAATELMPPPGELAWPDPH